MMNYKLKYAVTTAISLMALGFQHSSHALGLGDLEVISYLGEPLKAQVTLFGANELKSPSCLRLGEQSNIKNLKLNLAGTQSGNAFVTISSDNVVNEPIINLSVVAGCNSSIQRDYVLLLDPPLVGQTAINQTGQNVNTQAVENTNNSVVTSTIDAVAMAPATIEKPAERAQKTKKSAKKKSSASKKKNVYKPKQTTIIKNANTQTTDVSAKKQTQPQPMLKISGGAGNYPQSMALRMDTSLTFVTDPKATPIEDIALEDEVTVMNNRLAHLQSQISLLQEKNLKLASENKKQAAQLAMAKSSQGFNFWPILGAGLLLMSGYAVFTMIRRRQLAIQLENAPYLWSDDQTNTAEEKAIATPKIEEAKIDSTSAAFTQTEDASESNITSNTDSMDLGPETGDEQDILIEDEQEFSVLDHADVFLSHGRSGLAIQLLQNHLLEFPKQSVTIWLFLLDLLAKENNQALYEETALDCRLHYNIHISPFSKPETISSDSLEDFPRLAQGLENVWDTPAALNYLDDLIYNNRLEPRAGLPKNLIEELLVLRAIAQDNATSADVIKLDEKKLAMVEQKEVILEQRKQQKLKELADAQQEAKAKEEQAIQDELETDFEFTLLEK